MYTITPEALEIQLSHFDFWFLDRRQREDVEVKHLETCSKIWKEVKHSISNIPTSKQTQAHPSDHQSISPIPKAI